MAPAERPDLAPGARGGSAPALRPARHRCPGPTQRGIALISAMLIAALVTAGAVALAAGQQFATRRVANILGAAVAQTGVSEIEMQAGEVLREDAREGNFDAADEAWAAETFPLSVGELEVKGELRDLQGLFNLTNLSPEPRYAAGSGTTGGAGGGDPGPTSAGATTPEAIDAAAAGGNAGGSSAIADSAAPAARTPGSTGNRALFARLSGTNPITKAQRDAGQYAKFGIGFAPAPPMERPNYKARAAIIGAPRATLGSPSAETLSQAGAAGTDADGTSGDAALTDSAQARGNGETSLAPHELAEQRLRLLFGALSIDPQPIQAILDWIDPDTETRFPHGAEDDYYTNQKPAYRAANRPFTSPRELLLVRGIDREIYDKLAPFVVCLPIATPINLNTAPKEILQSLSPNLDAGTVEILLRARATQPFTDLAAFIQHPLIQFRRIPTTDLSVSSEYFELRSHAHNRRFEHRLASVLARRGDIVTTVRRWRENFDE